MSDEVIPHLTLLSGPTQETAREVRLMRLQLDNLVARAAGADQRIGVLEQSFHELVGEVARGFGQLQQQVSRQEKRLDAIDAGLTSLRETAAESVRQMGELVALLRR
jgi:hypothetical protein